MNSRRDGGCRRRMLASTVFVLAALALPTSRASAQANCQGLTSTQCAQASDQYQLLSIFSTLPSSPGGVAFLQNVLAADIALYQNATPAQRNQAAANADLTDPVPQQNIWGMLTSTNQLFPTLAQTFPQVRVSAPLAATVGAQLPAQSGVYAQITTLLDSIGNIQQIGALKDAFTSYAQVFQQVTSFANSGNVDPRPFQTSLSVGGAPWTGSQASASAQSTQNAQWLGLLTSGAFPSGHSADGFTTSLLYAIMLPQAYQSLIESGEQFGLSRNIIGAHYPTDVIGSRILTYYTMTQLLANNPLYNIGISNFQAYTQQLGNQLSASLGSAAAVPYANCASTIASCIASGTFATASQLTAANNAYVQQATYGLSFGATNLAPVVPQNAQLLIASRFPYLSNSQLVDVLATTELPSGVPLDDGSGWARLNLFAAGGGYGAFNANVTVNMNAALGGFNAIDFWTNNIGGSGSLTKTGTGTLSLGTNGLAGNGLNDHFLFSGDINVNGGTLLTQWTSDIYTKSKLTITTGATLRLDAANTCVLSLFGTAGTITGQPAGGGSNLFVAYTGTDPTAGFTGTLTAGSGYQTNIVNTGSGDLTFGTAAAGGRVSSVGTGKVTAIAITGNSSGTMVSTPFARVVLTGNSGVVNGANGVTQLYGGTLTLAPSGSAANVLVTGQGLSSTFRVRIAGGGTLQLDKGSNTSMEYRVGLSTNTNTDFLQFVSNGSGPGSLILDPVGGASTLGSATGAKFTILNSTTGKILSNGILPIPIFVVDNDGTKKGDFVTYNGTGVAGDAGYQQATYTLTDTFSGSSNVTVVKNTVGQTISANTNAFALRNDSTISIDATKTLTLGAPPAVNGNATATQSPNSGLILNGGTISGAGTLALGTTAAVIYTSNSGGTISANMTGSGGTNAGYGAYSGNTPVSLTKSGAGTLTLSGANTYTGATVINAGAVDVGTISAIGGSADKLAGSQGNLTFNGGVIQGNGTFARSLGGGSNQVTWNGINHTNSNTSGGFAAKGGDLTVAMGGTGSPTALIWGIAATNQNNIAGYTTPEFISEVGNVGNPSGQTGVLMFGSDTSDSQVDFKNAIDLGNVTANAAIGGYSSPLYYRIINVAQGTGTDSAKISGVISSTVEHGIIKDGAGKLILSGTNTYTGDTVVAHGTLAINGNQAAATGAVTVNSGAVLGGSGTIGGTVGVLSGGHFAPGNSISATFATGALTLASGSFADIELGAAGASHAAPGTSDRTAVSGSLVLGGTLNVINNAGANGDGSIGGGSYKIFTQTGTPTGSFTSVVNVAGYHAKVDTATSGSVYLDNYALATTGTIGAVNLGKARVGGSFSGSGAVTVTNATAANNGFTEGLNATQGAYSGVTVGGSNVSNLAGASSSTSLTVGLSSATSGAKSGTTTISLSSSGTNSGGYADTSLGSQTVGVSGSVYDYAAAVFSQASGVGTWTVVSPTSYTLDFGAGLTLGTNYTATINLANGTFFNAFQDNLGGSFSGGGAGEFTNTAAGFSNLVSNGNNSFTITFNTGSTGTFNGTLDFAGLSQQAGLSDANLANIQIAITATAVPEPAAALLGGLGLLSLLRRRRAGAAVLR